MTTTENPSLTRTFMISNFMDTSDHTRHPADIKVSNNILGQKLKRPLGYNYNTLNLELNK